MAIERPLRQTLLERQTGACQRARNMTETTLIEEASGQVSSKATRIYSAS